MPDRKELLRADYLKRLQLKVRRPDGTEINYKERLRMPSQQGVESGAKDAFEEAFELHWRLAESGEYDVNEEEKLFQQFVYVFDGQVRALLQSPHALTRNWAQRYLQEFLSRYCQSSRIRMMLPLEEDRRDCFSDAFVTFIDKITRPEFALRQPIAFKSLFWKIYRDKCVDFLRKKTAKKNNREVPWAADDEEMMRKLSGNAIQKVQEAAQRISMADIRAAMNRLSPACQQILHHFYFDGYDLEGISEELGMTYDSAKASKSRCMNHLRHMIRQQ